MKVAIIGYGGRGMLYAGILQEKQVEIAAICDIDQTKLAIAQKRLGISDERLFQNEQSFFAHKRADILFVCTQDELHLRHALAGLRAGYDLLLEKPIATNPNHCEAIEQEAAKTGRKVFVCHVLRYAPFFYEIKKQIDSGRYGKAVTISLTENVAYWHQAHSYVRGNWRNDKNAAPMIIAKCCHDLDLLSWFVGCECKRVSSFGSLSVFNRSHAPEGAAERCLDCRYQEECSYSAKNIYIRDRAEKGLLGWPCDIVVSEPTVEKLYQALKTSPYGRCVYACDNNVVDHQVVNMLFSNGATAQLTMTAFSQECYREIHVHLEHGEIYGNMKENKLYVNIFGKEKQEVININIVSDTAYGHGGGDFRMIEDIIDYYKGLPSQDFTALKNSMQSHYIGFAAEKSRLAGGEIVTL